MNGITGKLLWGTAALCLFVSFVLYWQTLDDEFHFDDPRVVTENQDVLSGNFTVLARYQRAVTALSFGIDYALAGKSPFWFHFISIVLFAGVCSLIPLLLVLLEKEKSAKRTMIACGLGITFAVHPICTQAVAYLSQRSELLCALFSLLTIIFYLKARGKTAGAKWIWYLLSVLGIALAIRSKETGVAVIPVIFLLEWLIINDDTPLWKKTGYLAGPILSALTFFPIGIAGVVKGKPAALENLKDINPDAPITVFEFFINGQAALFKYLWLIAIPYGQTIDHHVQTSHTFLNPKIFLSLSALIAIGIFAFRQREKRPLIFLGLCWIWLFFAPVTTFFPLDDIVAEHRAFIPFIGILIAVYALFRKLKVHRFSIGVFILAASVLFTISFIRLSVWDTDMALWKDAVEKSPGKARPWNNLGIAYVENKEYDKGQKAFAKAVDLNPKYFQAHENLANSCVMLGDWACAANHYKAALEIKFDPFLKVNWHKALQMAEKYNK